MNKFNPLIEPERGNGRSRWRQTTRRNYINKQNRLGLEVLPAVPASIIKVKQDLPPTPIPVKYKSKKVFYDIKPKPNGFVSRLRGDVYVNPLLCQ